MVCKRCLSQGTKELYQFDIPGGKTFIWDVVKAQRIVQADGREPWIITNANTLAPHGDVDEDHVEHVDASIPCLVTNIRHNDETTQTLIDGNHRLRKCLLHGLPFEAYMLTVEESSECLIKNKDALLQHHLAILRRMGFPPDAAVLLAKLTMAKMLAECGEIQPTCDLDENPGNSQGKTNKNLFKISS